MTHPPVPPPGRYPLPEGYPPPPSGNYPPPPPGGHHPEAPAGALPKHAYTSWLTRVAASLIDLVPVAVLTFIGQALMFGTAQSRTGMSWVFPGQTCWQGDPVLECYHITASGLVMGLIFGLAALAFAIWNYGYRQGTTGSSIGKSVLKFKVVSERTGQPIGFGRSVVRQLAHIVDGLVCYVGYLFPLWDVKRQTIADKIMSTVCLPV